MTLGSLFDGSGGFPLAGAMYGIEPVWASEVEPYPIAVTTSRFPNVKHLGSVTDINGGEIEPVDIITFGSPCQDLSVAGQRAGLKHTAAGDDETTRSGLFMEAIRIIKEMREKTNGRFPTIAIWENVPGAFSSNKGEDFRIVLESFCKIIDENASVPRPPKGKWSNAGSIVADGGSIAWRVLNSQFFGTAQRRRRIYLVADFGGDRAAKILFKQEGLRGYFTESGSPWKGTAEAPSGCIGATGFDGYNGDLTGNVSSTLGVNCGMSSGRNGVVLNDQSGSRMDVTYDVTATLRAEAHHPPIVMESVNGRNCLTPWDVQSRRIYTTDGTWAALYSGEGGGRGYIAYAVEQTYSLQGNGIDRADTAGCNGKGVKEEIGYTLNTVDRHGVAYTIKPRGGEPVVAYGFDAYNQVMTDNTAKTLTSGASDADHIPCVVKTYPQHIVLRLTPTECARLQGFPDNWGHPDIYEDFTEEQETFWRKVRQTDDAIKGRKPKEYTKDQLIKWYNKLHTDSAEYKMWGNGIALPCVMYVMQGIMEEIANG